MAEYTDPVAALRQAIDQLNEILLGDEQDTVTIDGIVKPSISKAIADSFDELSAMAYGATGYATLADLSAAGEPAQGAGALAWVTNDADADSNGLYSWDGSAWVQSSYDRYTELANEIDAFISASRTDTTGDALSSSGRPVSYAITDKTGRAALTIDDEGGADLPGGLAGLLHERTETAGALWALTDAVGRMALSVGKSGAVSVAGMGVSLENSGFPFIMADEKGRMSWAIDRQGKRVDFTAPTAPEPDSDDIVSLEEMANVQTDYMAGTSYGQSLSIGTNAYPPVSTVQPYSNVMFLSGVTPSDPDSTSDPINYSGFTPLIEERDSSVHGETPVSGTLNGLIELLEADGKDSSEWQFVGNAPGRGGTRIAYLIKGSENYSWMLQQWEAAQSLAQDEGKSFSVWHVTWTQGEEDYDQDTSYDAYLAYFLDLVETIGQDAHRITGQSFHPVVPVYQSGSNRGYGRNHINVAMAQWQASRQNPNIIMATPVYPIPTNPNDVHLTAESSRRLGRYYARALHYSLFSGGGEKWRPLEPEPVIWQGRVIDVSFNVPYGGMVIDTDQVALAPNYGFDIYDGEVVADIISSVTIVGGNRIRIVLDAEPPAGAVLSYARGRPGDPASNGPVTGPRGNIRDEHGDVDSYQGDGGETIRMDNWCIVFQYQMKSGAI